MARQYGRAGNTLLRQITLYVVIALVLWLVVYLLMRALLPAFAGFAWVVALIPVFKFLELTRKDAHAITKGYAGEARAGKLLAGLPEGWRVFHDVNLDGENADHVVVSNRGVFNVEVKNYGGGVLVTQKGLFTHGKRNDKVVKQAWRQVRKLTELLGVEVVPLLVFTGGDLKQESPTVGKLRVLPANELRAHFAAMQGPVLSLEEGRRVSGVLAGRTRR